MIANPVIIAKAWIKGVKMSNPILKEITELIGDLNILLVKAFNTGELLDEARFYGQHRKHNVFIYLSNASKNIEFYESCVSSDIAGQREYLSKFSYNFDLVIAETMSEYNLSVLKKHKIPVYCKEKKQMIPVLSANYWNKIIKRS